MTNIFTSSNAIDAGAALIDKNDVALILKADGSCHALTFGYDRNRLLAPEAEHTEEDRKMLEQGARLFALAFAVGHPKLMKVLTDIATDPDVVDFDTLTATKTRH
ncbi:hypothetical protein GFL39_26270 [Rhizobium leguminosarum bv. viciae]|uniref:hypothetical protein n=1 Tax=Rhizobium leguminosarum TaxID=384 RepID=UPI001442936C|nr:hypothetical protein [Rhizobium leguminosarum]NKL08378.1 hypothetical protein [Rhizobium leguminosarum bv. viciae]